MFISVKGIFNFAFKFRDLTLQTLILNCDSLLEGVVVGRF